MHDLFNTPGPLRESLRRRVAVEQGADLLAASKALFAVFRKFRDRVPSESGELRSHVNLFVGTENVRSISALTTPLRLGPKSRFSLPSAWQAAINRSGNSVNWQTETAKKGVH